MKEFKIYAFLALAIVGATCWLVPQVFFSHYVSSVVCVVGAMLVAAKYHTDKKLYLDYLSGYVIGVIAAYFFVPAPYLSTPAF